MKIVKVVPIIIRALETVSNDIDRWLKGNGIECPVELLPEVCLLSAEKIIRRMISTWKTIERWWITKVTSSNSLPT